jgi:hypothetical protein
VSARGWGWGRGLTSNIDDRDFALGWIGGVLAHRLGERVAVDVLVQRLE